MPDSIHSASHLAQISLLNSKDYEPLLRESLQCWRCEEMIKNIPSLKDHLKEHFEKDLEKAKKRQERSVDSKRKRESAGDEEIDAPVSQKRKDDSRG